jgi:hypothetical chaperone protein
LRAVGIDFGTTNCAVAVSTGGIVETARFGAAALETFRSVLYFEGAQSRGRKRPMAGPAAIDAYLARETPGRLIQSLKSFLSSALFRETWVNNERYSVEDLTASMALSLREQAERQFGDLGKRVVLGRPVRFVGADTREADALAVSRLEQAFRRAGFDEIILEFEPVGAAYFYESTLDHDERIVIADFGGGTSDFSLLKVGPAPEAPRHRRDRGLAVSRRRLRREDRFAMWCRHPRGYLSGGAGGGLEAPEQLPAVRQGDGARRWPCCCHPSRHSLPL